MKLTSEELAKLLGIKIGDKIKFSNGRIVDVIKDYVLDFHPLKASLYVIIDEEFEIVQPKKKLGEKLCMDFDCNKCPLFVINCDNSINSSLYEKLEQTFVDVNDDELYNILKARLDEEIEQ